MERYNNDERDNSDEPVESSDADEFHDEFFDSEGVEIDRVECGAKRKFVRNFSRKRLDDDEDIIWVHKNLKLSSDSEDINWVHNVLVDLEKVDAQRFKCVEWSSTEMAPETKRQVCSRPVHS